MRSNALVPAMAAVGWFTQAGFNAVAMFFILSGFILLHTYRDRFEVFSWPEYFRFLGLRLARIYPAYLAALAAMVALVVAASFAWRGSFAHGLSTGVAVAGGTDASCVVARYTGNPECGGRAF